MDRPSFNGAADRSRRIGGAAKDDRIVSQLLQWGRRQESTDRSATAAAVPASVPLQWGRRQESTDRCCGSTAASGPPCFNGAADRSRRIDYQAVLDSEWDPRLQWGRRQESTDSSARARWSVWSWGLQWGRRQESTDSPRQTRSALSATGCFNGAADRSRRIAK